MGGSLGSNTSNSVMPSAAPSLGSQEPTNTLSAPFALALAQQAAQAIQSQATQSSVVVSQQLPNPVNGKSMG